MREVPHTGTSGAGNLAVEHGAEENRVAVSAVQARKLRPCRWCKTVFTPARALQVACSPSCALNLARELEHKKQAKEARKAKAEYRKKSMSLSKLKNLAQREVNRFVRERDANEGCISCDMPASYGGQFHAGHYRTTAAAPQLRYDVRQIRKQCAQCNSMKSGNVIEYRKRLVLLIGADAVEEIENDSRIHRWTREELTAIRKEYHAKWKALVAEREGKA